MSLRTSVKLHTGFTLLELSVVLVLAGILLTLGMGALTLHQDYSALSSTQRRMETVKDALIAYLREHRRLPCPETLGLSNSPPAGREGRTVPPLCNSYVGTLPWLDLGVPKEAAMDGFSHFFTYYVSSSRNPSEPDWTLTANAATSTPGFSTGSPGRFAVTQDGTPTTADGSNPIPPFAAVVLVSHGKNGYGAIAAKGTRIDSASADECEKGNIALGIGSPPAWNSQNAQPLQTIKPAITKTLFSGRHEICRTSAGVLSMDDIVMPLRSNDLLMPLIKDGGMKSAQAVVQESLATAIEIAISEMISLSPTCKPKATLTKPLPVDGWGSAIHYETDGLLLNASTDLTKTAFSVWSNGADRTSAAGASDDVVPVTGKDITYGQIRARLPATACP